MNQQENFAVYLVKSLKESRMEQETIIYTDKRGIEITSSRARIGRKAFSIAEIEQITIQEHKPNRNLYMIVIEVILMVMLYIAFDSIYAPLFLVIISLPSTVGMMRAKPFFSLNIKTSFQRFRPIVAKDREELEVVKDKIEKAIQDFNPDTYIPTEEESYEIPGTDSNFTRTVADNCPKCDLAMTVNDVVWMDMNTGKCPRCGSEVEITWKRT